MTAKRMKRSVFFTLIILLASSCLKETVQDLSEIKGVSLNPELSIPLLNTNLAITDLYNSASKQGYVREDNTKFLTFVYEQRDSLGPKQLISIPTANLTYDLTMDQASAAQFEALGKFSNTFSNYAVIKTGNKERIKNYRIKKGSFVVNVNSTFKHDAKLVFFYPSITKRGVPLVDTINIPYPTAMPITKNISLDGYDVDLSDGGISYNVVPYMFEINLERNPSQLVETNQKITVNETFKVDEYSFINGYLGKFDILNYAETHYLDLFDKQIDGNVFLNDPRIIIRLQNGMGIPIVAKVSNVRVVTARGVTVPVRLEEFKDTFSLPHPKIQGQVMAGQYVIDKTNSNIDSVFSLAPQYVYYDLVFTANYNENFRDDNFVIWDNDFKSSGSIEIPLDLKVLKYTVEQVSDFGSQDTAESDLSIEYVTFHTSSANKLPFDGHIQVLFLDSVQGSPAYTIVDSLFAEEMPIAGAIIDMAGNILAPGILTSMRQVPRARFDNIKKCEKYMVRVRMNSSNAGGVSPFVKVYSDQVLSLKVGVESKLKYYIKTGN